MLWPKKNSYKEFDNEKYSFGSKIPLLHTLCEGEKVGARTGMY